jgi:integrase
LRWRNVDLDTRELHVDDAKVPARKGIATGKTKSGRSRSVRIPEFAVALLRQHRPAQAEQLLTLGVRLDGNGYGYGVPSSRWLPDQPQVFVSLVPRQLADRLPRTEAHPRFSAS